MSETRSTLERELERLSPPRIPFDQLGQRRDRRRRDQRIRAGVLGIVVAIAVGWLGANAIRSGSRSQPASPPTPTLVPPPTPSPTREPAVIPLDISLVDIRTGEATPLPASILSMVRADHLQVSPDGERLAFDDGDRIYVANVDGSDLRPITDGITPSWSPDGRSVAYQLGGELFVTDLGTGSVEHIFDGDRLVYHPNFSADGQHILFTWLKPGTEGFALWTIPIEGGEPRALPLPHSVHTFPAFGTYSPDGATIAYRRTQFDGIDITQMTSDTVWVAEADGSHPRPVSGRAGAWMSQIDPQALWPSWSPDGTRIAYELLYSRGVYVVDLSSGNRTRIGGGTNPVWLDDETLVVEGYDRNDTDL